MAKPDMNLWTLGAGEFDFAYANWMVGATTLFARSTCILTHSFPWRLTSSTPVNIRGTVSTAKITAITGGAYGLAFGFCDVGVGNAVVYAQLWNTAGWELDIATATKFAHTVFGALPTLPVWLVCRVTTDLSTVTAELWVTDPTLGGTPTQTVTTTFS
jgi:hypothetical protein